MHYVFSRYDSLRLFLSALTSLSVHLAAVVLVSNCNGASLISPPSPRPGPMSSRADNLPVRTIDLDSTNSVVHRPGLCPEVQSATGTRTCTILSKWASSIATFLLNRTRQCTHVTKVFAYNCLYVLFWEK